MFFSIQMPPPRSSFTVFPESSKHLFIVQLIGFNAIMITLKDNDERRVAVYVRWALVHP